MPTREIDLAWRVWDGGFHVRYDGSIEVHHPAIQPTRHAEFYRFQARNRVWLARRNLPVPVGAAYLAAWAAVSGLRLRSKESLRETCGLPPRVHRVRWGTAPDELAYGLADDESRAPARSLGPARASALNRPMFLLLVDGKACRLLGRPASKDARPPTLAGRLLVCGGENREWLELGDRAG